MTHISKEGDSLIPRHPPVEINENERIRPLIDRIIQRGKEAFDIDNADYTDKKHIRPSPIVFSMNEPRYREGAQNCAFAVADFLHEMSLVPQGTRLEQSWGIGEHDFSDDPLFTSDMFMTPVSNLERATWENMANTLKDPMRASVPEVFVAGSLLRRRSEYFQNEAYNAKNYGTDKGRTYAYCMVAFEQAASYLVHMNDSRGISFLDLNGSIARSKVDIRIP